MTRGYALCWRSPSGAPQRREYDYGDLLKALQQQQQLWEMARKAEAAGKPGPSEIDLVVVME